MELLKNGKMKPTAGNIHELANCIGLQSWQSSTSSKAARITIAYHPLAEERPRMSADAAGDYTEVNAYMGSVRRQDFDAAVIEMIQIAANVC